MAASYDFVQLDVFTRTALTGNPLAVFIDGRGLTDEEMQAEFRRQKLLGPSYSRAKPLALKFSMSNRTYFGISPPALRSGTGDLQRWGTGRTSGLRAYDDTAVD